MANLGQTVLLCLAIELAVVWVLRVRTSLLRRTPVERLLYVAGLGTLVTQPIAVMLVRDSSRRLGFVVAAVAIMALVWLAETGLYRSLGRLGWRKAALFSGLANGASLLVLLALYVLGRR